MAPPVEIDSFRPSDLRWIVSFVEAIQEHERAGVPELKPGSEIGSAYAERLVRTIAARNGVILVARAAEEKVGFACAWLEHDDDPLLREDARAHAYVSDIFVVEEWRRRGVAGQLLEAVEAEMRKRGCRRMRINAKAGNAAGLRFYEAVGYRAYEVTFTKSIPDRR
jgi:GNAT superfamily N-acetyltransferase